MIDGLYTKTQELVAMAFVEHTDAKADPDPPGLPGMQPQRKFNPLVDGPVARTLLFFSLPILASSVLQSINASVNAIWISHLIGTRALTASANANSLLFFLLSISFGLGMAASILVGQSLGAGNVRQAKRIVGTALVFFGAVSCLASVIGAVLSPQTLLAMHTPPDALPLAVAYLQVIYVALPGMYLYTFVMMALRGAGDSRTPFFFLLISAVLDIGLNPVLMRGFGPWAGLGIAGSALATAISQWVTLVALIFWLYRSGHLLRIGRSELDCFRIDPTILQTLIGKGIPMGLQMIVMSSSMIMMISLVNDYGTLTVAAYGACFQLWNYIQMPAFSVGSAVSSMTALNIGARRWDRVSAITRAGVIYNVLLIGGLVLVVTLVDRAAFGLFLGNAPVAIDIARHIHLIVSWSFILFGISFVLASVVRATGAVIAPLVILFVAIWLVRIPVAKILTPWLDADALWWSFPIGSATSLLLTFAYYRLGPWRQFRMAAAGT
jgi:putative MATE family efflux protein